MASISIDDLPAWTSGQAERKMVELGGSVNISPSAFPGALISSKNPAGYVNEFITHATMANPPNSVSVDVSDALSALNVCEMSLQYMPPPQRNGLAAYVRELAAKLGEPQKNSLLARCLEKVEAAST